jgi:hypothetical protein
MFAVSPTSPMLTSPTFGWHAERTKIGSHIEDRDEPKHFVASKYEIVDNFAISGKFGAVFASIPFPIFAALYCILFGIVSKFFLFLYYLTNVLYSNNKQQTTPQASRLHFTSGDIPVSTSLKQLGSFLSNKKIDQPIFIFLQNFELILN